MDAILQVDGLSKAFGGTCVLRDLSLSLLPGQIVALVGPNGAGKTTFFNLCTGFSRADAGLILHKGYDISFASAAQIVCRGIARTFQEPRFVSSMTVRENVLFASCRKRSESLCAVLNPFRSRVDEREAAERADECLKSIGLTDKSSFYPTNLSYGQQKCLSLACCLATGADLLLLDEPAAGVDSGTLKLIVDSLLALRSMGKTLLLIEHNLSFVNTIANNVLVMGEGRVIASGPWDQLLNAPEVQSVFLNPTDPG